MPPEPRSPKATTAVIVKEALAWLERTGTKKNRDGLARYAITTDSAFGVSVADIRAHAKKVGRNHDVALALWESGRYEARMMASFVDDPGQVTVRQMDDWCRDFDNWAICDTPCFHLFDKTPHAWGRIAKWSSRKAEFEKRAAFALLASVALHDKKEGDARFLGALDLIERESCDERNFVKKAVNWALRGIGKRNATLKAASVVLSRTLADSDDRTARWIGKDALRALVK